MDVCSTVRLGQIIIHPGRQATLAILITSIGGQRQHRQTWPATRLFELTPGTTGRKTIKYRHLAIQQYQIETILLQQLERLLTIAHHQHVQTIALKMGPRQDLIAFVILYQQHSATQQRGRHRFVLRHRAHFRRQSLYTRQAEMHGKT